MKIIFRIIFVILLIFMLFVVMRAFVVDWYVVDSNSMQPTLDSGDVIIVSKLSKVRRNDIAVFYLKDKDVAIVKRCVAVPEKRVILAQR